MGHAHSPLVAPMSSIFVPVARLDLKPIIERVALRVKKGGGKAIENTKIESLSAATRRGSREQGDAAHGARRRDQAREREGGEGGRRHKH
jgi:hypothetical protein